MSWDQFWHMGGFAFFVWSAYAFTAVVVIINTVAPLIKGRAIRRQMHQENDEIEDGR